MDKVTKKNIPLVYVMSANHSGSTLMSHVLHAHSHIVGLGEVEKLASFVPLDNRAPCTCGASFKTCAFWGGFMSHAAFAPLLQTRVRHMRQSTKNFLLGNDTFFVHTRSDAAPSVKEYIAGLTATYHYALDTAQADYVVDATKNIDQLSAYVKHAEHISLYVIHLVRDPRGVVWSYQKKYGNWRYAIRHWLSTNMKTSILKWRFPKEVRVKTIRYEDFVADPEGVLTVILDELGLSYEPEMLEYQNVPHHFCGGNRKTSVKSSVISLDTGWKQQMGGFKKLVTGVCTLWLYRFY